jgi:hypothetical protein
MQAEHRERMRNTRELKAQLEAIEKRPEVALERVLEVSADTRLFQW